MQHLKNYDRINGDSSQNVKDPHTIKKKDWVKFQPQTLFLFPYYYREAQAKNLYYGGKRRQMGGRARLKARGIFLKERQERQKISSSWHLGAL